IPGWTYRGGYVWVPGYAGNMGVDDPQYIGIGGDFSQTLRTMPGQGYELTFSRRTSPTIIQEGPVAIRVQWGSQNLGDFAIPNPSGWITESVVVTATKSDSLLKFSTVYGAIPFMDGVSVIAIPEPSSTALLILSGFAVWVMRHDRSQKSRIR